MGSQERSAAYLNGITRWGEGAATLILTAFVCRLKDLFIEIRNASHQLPVTKKHIRH